MNAARETGPDPAAESASESVAEIPASASDGSGPAVGDTAPLTADTGALVKEVLLYTGFRLLLVLVIFGVLYGIGYLVLGVLPWIPVALFALVLAMPVSMFVGKRWRTRINLRAAVVDDARKAKRADFRARLEGRAE